MLNQDEYDKIRNIIYENTGMALKETKIDFLSRRVETRMRELDLERARDYCRFLQLDSTQREIEELVNLVVVSETYFFRDYKQLKVLAEAIIPLVAEEKKKLGRHGISVLSAGCSTGEEPYTLAIIFREMLEDDHVRRLRIDGLDINRKSLEKARKASTQTTLSGRRPICTETSISPGRAICIGWTKASKAWSVFPGRTCSIKGKWDAWDFTTSCFAETC